MAAILPNYSGLPHPQWKIGQFQNCPKVGQVFCRNSCQPFYNHFGHNKLDSHNKGEPHLSHHLEGLKFKKEINITNISIYIGKI